MKDLRRFLAIFSIFSVIALLVAFPAPAFTQHSDEHKSEQPAEHVTDSAHTNIGHDEHADTSHAHACHFHEQVIEEEYDATSTAFHHISDANVYSIG
jgi:hypothetical protein